MRNPILTERVISAAAAHSIVLLLFLLEVFLVGMSFLINTLPKDALARSSISGSSQRTAALVAPPGMFC
jgi:hypothetical protein